MSINNKKIIGLTGMSGAGKSTACTVFARFGFDIIDCDKICRIIVEKGKPCLTEIVNVFGEGILTENQELNRREMAKIIFSDEEKRLTLNGIMYPYVSYLVIESILDSKSDYVMLDAPTLFESGVDDMCDTVVSVVAEKQAVINRIVKRDNISEAEAENRLRSQQSKDFYIKNSRYVISNNGAAKDFITLLETTAKKIKGEQ